MKKISLLFLQLISFGFLYAQNTAADSSLYNPHDFFVQPFNPTAGNIFRSANGTPGPMYWQNSADYQLHATLSEKDTSVT
jgi:hypothetical protein